LTGTCGKFLGCELETSHKEGKDCFNYRCETSKNGDEHISYVEFLDEHGNLIQRENVAPWYLGGDDRGDPYCLEACSYEKVTVVGWLDVDQSDRIEDIHCFSKDFYPCETEEPKEKKSDSKKESSKDSKKKSGSKKESSKDGEKKKSSGSKKSSKDGEKKSSGSKKSSKDGKKKSGSKKSSMKSDKKKHH